MNPLKKDSHYGEVVKACDNQQLLTMLWHIGSELSNRTHEAQVITIYQGDCEVLTTRRIKFRAYERLKAAIANLVELGKS